MLALCFFEVRIDAYGWAEQDMYEQQKNWKKSFRKRTLCTTMQSKNWRKR